jgi:L-ribulose-5-phosphate 3-epimerase
MKYGIMQNVLQASLPELFSLAKQLGFDGVELDWYTASDLEHGALAPDRRAGIRAAANQAGIEIASVAAHFLSQGGIASLDPATQQAGVQVIRAGITLCQEVGARVLLVPFFGAGAIEGEAGIERLLHNLHILAHDAEAAGVVIGIEHMLPATTTVMLLERLGSPAVQTYWDMANCLGHGYDPVAEVHTLGRHLVQVHAKEYVAQGTMRPFGQGDVPVAAVFAALHQIGYQNYVVLETAIFGEPIESAAAAFQVLRQYQ